MALDASVMSSGGWNLTCNNGMSQTQLKSDRRLHPSIVFFVSAFCKLDEINSVQAFEEIGPSVVQITWFDKSKKLLNSGTGVVWNEEGFCTSNYHVIAGADASNLRATFADKTTSDKVRVLSCFRDLDLAVLHLDAPRDKLRPIPVGDSANLLIGQKAYAIGHPHGFQNSFSGGYISGVDRAVASTVTGVQIRGVIQTDASINPGNSGGPLLDSSKKLIGINTSLISPGVAFAIPGNVVREIVDGVVRSANDISSNLGIESLPHHPIEWCIDIQNSANANEMCVEVNEIVKAALRSMKDSRPSLGIEASPYHSVERSGDILLSADGVIVEAKPKHCSHFHRSADDFVRYLLGEDHQLDVISNILWDFGWWGEATMPNREVIVYRGFCKECGKLRLDILPYDPVDEYRLGGIVPTEHERKELGTIIEKYFKEKARLDAGQTSTIY